MNEVERFLDHSYYGNSLWQWTIAATVLVSVLLVTLLIRRVIRSRYQRLAATPQTELMELPLKVASHTGLLFLVIVSVYAACSVLSLPPKLAKLLLTLLTISAFWQAGVWISTAITSWLSLKQQQALAHDRAAAGSFAIITFVARALIWAIVLLLTLDNLGVNITTLVAGLGIGGIAVALAVQNVLGDLLASLSITLDRPFVVGDAIAVGDFNGTVEQIGIKSVRLRSVNGEQIVMSNADLLSSRVRNFGRMRERRVAFTVGVALDSPPAKLQKLPAALRSIVESEKSTRFDRAHFARIGPGSLDFETVYYVTTANYGTYMDIQQNINLRIIEMLDKEKLELAVPVQRVWQQATAGLEAGPEKT
ncbi:MAG TPA: mechanosensitive ion channel family protein [Povalibacter sp.]|uniref:mechanosensitive ion channel family protein n=1 Tax=Povalibacter sp. TaxID=1962978 RepID=UPI002BA20183|nr:mechanosensitive ion channel family protein [Povalibacter sp.]HMN43583.1 mechanosensitive ion channel family protein [Povalibacter sp.]